MPANPDVLHPVLISQVMIHLGARHGVDLDTCLLGTGMTAEVLDDADSLITRAQEMRLVENLMLALPEVPALGFELGLQYNISTFGIWGFALRSSRTLSEAMQRAIRYLPLSTAYCHFSMLDSAQGFGWTIDPEQVPPQLRQFLLERDTATALNLVRELGLSGIELARLEFCGPAPAHAARIEQLSGVAPRYGSSRNALILRAEDAERRLPMYDEHLVRMLEERCKAQLEQRTVSGIAGRVRAELLGPLGLVATHEEVAGRLAMSSRSLRRKLDEEKTSFRAIVEAERRALAEQLLQGTQMKLDELALHLGYADTASFTRAFRRWTGQSPGEYRNGPLR